MGITLDWRALGGILPERGGRRSGPAGLLRLPPVSLLAAHVCTCMYLRRKANRHTSPRGSRGCRNFSHPPTPPRAATAAGRGGGQAHPTEPRLGYAPHKPTPCAFTETAVGGGTGCLILLPHGRRAANVAHPRDAEERKEKRGTHKHSTAAHTRTKIRATPMEINKSLGVTVMYVPACTSHTAQTFPGRTDGN